MSVNWRRIAERFPNAPEPHLYERKLFMNGKLYCIYDRKSSAYAPPMFFQNDDVLKRSLRLEFEQKPMSPVVSYPEDYELWCVGSFSTDDGSVAEKHEFLCSCVEVVRKAVGSPAVVGPSSKGAGECP